VVSWCVETRPSNVDEMYASCQRGVGLDYLPRVLGRGGLVGLAETIGTDVPAAAVGNVGFLR
jgi:hypothetical protein